EADPDDHHDKARDRVCCWRTAVVIGEDDERYVPYRPDESAHERGACERQPFGELRYQEAAPAEFFAKRVDQARENAEDDESPHGYVKPAEIYTTESGYPHRAVGCRCIDDGKQVTDDFIPRRSP